MIKFIGEYRATVDDKGRVVFPAPLKSLIHPTGDLRFVIKKDLFFNCLEMYSYQEWVRESEEVKSRLNLFNREHALFWREFMRNRALVEPDEKVGRITIPKRLLEEIGVERELLFVGNDHKIEVWSTENYQKEQLIGDQYSQLAEKILG